jgi:hypothetical protein
MVQSESAPQELSNLNIFGGNFSVLPLVTEANLKSLNVSLETAVCFAQQNDELLRGDVSVPSWL